MNTEILFKEESYRIVGACFEVYREKGCGFLEPVYQECLEIELRLQGVPYVAQHPLALDKRHPPAGQVRAGFYLPRADNPRNQGGDGVE